MDVQRKREYQRKRYADMDIEAKHRKKESVIANKKKKTNLTIETACMASSSTGLHASITSDMIIDYNSCSSELYILEEPHSCLYCNAMLFQFEPPSLCCSNGEILLAQPNFPEELYDLFTSNSSESKQFQSKIRAYNSIFAFTSFGAHIDTELSNSKKGIYTFRAQGQIYHSLPPITKGQNGPCYFQLYIYDTESEAYNRSIVIDDLMLDENLITKLISVLSVNPYAQLFRSLSNRGPLDHLEIHIKGDVKLDQRVYNTPTISQVAAIWIEGDPTSNVIERDIVITSHSGTYRRIKHYFGCYDPLQYPLLFPNGEVGWHQNISRLSKAEKNYQHTQVLQPGATEEDIFRQEIHGILKTTTRRVSCREYYSYKLQYRSNDISIILHAGRLFHQYVVDMYVKIESSRLDFYRRNQHTIRSELYKGVVDSVTAGETLSNNIGQKIILPASFIGGPRDMRRRYLDAMALVQQFGKPDLFITVTCNPEWVEIQKNLKQGQSAQDRPDLIVRVFRAKIQDLKDQLFKKLIFGAVAAYVYVIEFQKRGLPHAHFLIILKNEFRLRNSSQFDRIVSAELPDPSIFKSLHDVVVKHMMHGPCGSLNKKNACMKNDVCKNKYPRFFSSQTSIGDDSYPVYRRRNNGYQVKVRNCLLDNRWVVPYNPYLLYRYNCHINVEICSGIKAVKYIYKYLYKGHDKIALSFLQENAERKLDEIQQYQDGRWVSAPEALWRIFEFDLSEMYPSVCNLQLHLQDMHSIYYKENQDLCYLLHDEKRKKTMLIEFFELNKKDSEARKYLYRNIPEKYVWKKTEKYWKPREKYEQVGRINTTNPSEGERYYLRILLNHVYGPTSFDDLLRVHDTQCFTFKEAAEKLGLLEANNYISDCLNDASIFQMPYQLRQLFAIILAYCEPTNTSQLWEVHFENLSHDFRLSEIHSDDFYKLKTLSSINSYLQSMGKCIAAFDLPKMPSGVINMDEEVDQIKNRELIEELNVITPIEDISSIDNLNADQKMAYKGIIKCVYKNDHGMFFIDGPGGTGKTYLYRALLATLRRNGHIALATATSGVAASILPGGRTTHSRFKIPINLTETTLCSIPKQSVLAELLRKTSLIIWDEAPMAKRTVIECVDRTLRDIMSKSDFFGGKVIVFGGDFRQVLPVVRRASKFETIQYSIVSSYLWSNMKIYKLRQNMRAIKDPFFSEFILKIGNGDDLETDDGFVKIPNEMLIKYENNDVGEHLLFNTIFPSLDQNAISSKYFSERAILATKNEYVDNLNEKLIKIFPGKEIIFFSFDSVTDDSSNLYQVKFLNTLTPTGFPPHQLILKENCPIMLLRNLDPSNGLCNGTRLVCRSFKKNIILAEILTGQSTGKLFMIPRIPLCPNEEENLPFSFKRNQFPIRLCFAMTINKSQGQTIPNVGIYLPQNVFSHGQLYVALSRGISIENTKLLIIPDQYASKEGPYTKNIVYKEMLTSS